MDWGWSPLHCLSCKVKSCEFCFHATTQDLDLKSLVLYTPLPELWDLFQTTIQIGQPSESGFNLLGLQSIAAFRDLELPIEQGQFWWVMKYFLRRVNDVFIAKRKAGRGK